LLTMLLRSYMDTRSLVISPIYLNYAWFIFVIAILWPMLLIANGMYPVNRMRTLGRTAGIIVRASLQGLMLLFALIFMVKISFVSRLVMIQFPIITAALLILKETIVAGSFHVRRARGLNVRNVLVVGTIGSVQKVINQLQDNTFLGLKVAGVLVPQEEVYVEKVCGQKVLGSFSDAKTIVDATPIDNVIITVKKGAYTEIENIIFQCEERGIEIWIMADIFNLRIAHLDVDELFGVPFFVFRSGPRLSWPLLFKSVVDRVGALALSILSLPVVIIAAVAIKRSSRGPIFFKQERCGVNGRRFTVYKLRTMHEGAEIMKKQLEAENIMSGPVFKIQNDPRVFPVGYILRKMSIDELPQFWNVLKGDMSLIGPRPAMPGEVGEYKGWQRRRLSMRPGITGLWQVSGRNKIVNFEERAKLDLRYIDEWSLWLDLKIFFSTVIVILKGTGS